MYKKDPDNTCRICQLTKITAYLVILEEDVYNPSQVILPLDGVELPSEHLEVHGVLVLGFPARLGRTNLFTLLLDLQASPTFLKELF
jgi:hypothetical protein